MLFRSSLKKLATELGIDKKLDLEATNTKGKYLADFTPYELELMKEYNKVDTDLCADLFKVLIKGFPKSELLHIHMTTQMLVAPKFVTDQDLLRSTLVAVQADKEAALVELADMLGVETNAEVKAMMASAARFSEIGRAHV